MASDLATPLLQKLAEPTQPAMQDAPAPAAAPTGPSDDELLDLWKEIRKEALQNRWMFERQWQRNIWYILGRQWIEYLSKYGGWRDKRIAQWIPRPVTNKCKETLQTIRAMFTAIQLGVNVRPNGRDPENVAAAATADELAPVLHEAHHMDDVMNEFDFWLIATGNAFIHSFVEYDIKNGVINIDQEQCQNCGAIYGSDELDPTHPTCPDCGQAEFAPAQDETGAPVPPAQKVQGRPTTLVLSPLEIAFSNSYARFEDVPEVVRLRWRTKSWMQAHPVLSKTLDLDKISWQKSPTDHSLQIFVNLSRYSDLGLSPTYASNGESAGGTTDEDGIVEYEVWKKPTVKYPQGLVFRVYGDSQTPIIAHLEESESIPGPLPYKQQDGTPLFPFAHAGYDHVGGRILASGPIDIIIQKQDQLNQLDSMLLLIVQRMSNPVWLEPKGSEIQKLTGMPGLVIKYQPSMIGGSNAKPERIPGMPVDQSLFAMREQYLKDIEELAGTFDILKGAKPAGVEAFAAMQLLVERSQSRFASVFQARGDVYKSWFKFACELEREFGPDERTKATLQPGRGWTFQSFKRANLNGSFSIIVEDGTAAPKTSLGMRAALDHAAGLGMVNLQDPDQQYAGLQLMGLTSMVPSLDIQVQGALQKQQAFEQWIADPRTQAQAVQLIAGYQQAVNATVQAGQMAMQHMQRTGQVVEPPPEPPSPMTSTPLKWRTWYSAQIHYAEFLKWANSDRIRNLIADPRIGPTVEAMLSLHQKDIEAALAQQQQPAAPGPNAAGQTLQQTQMQGSARAMTNSNQNAGSAVPPGRVA